MEPDARSFLTKRNIIALVVVLILLLAVPAAIFLVKQETRLKTRAGTEAITPVGLSKNANGDWEATSSTVLLELRSPLGPATGSGQGSY